TGTLKLTRFSTATGSACSARRCRNRLQEVKAEPRKAMNRLPQKISLVAQTASVLLEEIQGGRWVGSLPGEHALCAQLHVGRKTLRAALEQLRQEGRLKCERGRRRMIVSRGAARTTRRAMRAV